MTEAQHGGMADWRSTVPSRRRGRGWPCCTSRRSWRFWARASADEADTSGRPATKSDLSGL